MNRLAGILASFVLLVTLSSPVDAQSFNLSADWDIRAYDIQIETSPDVDTSSLLSTMGHYPVDVTQTGTTLSAAGVNGNNQPYTLSGTVAGNAVTFTIAGLGITPGVGPATTTYSGITDGRIISGTLQGSATAPWDDGAGNIIQVDFTWSGSFLVTAAPSTFTFENVLAAFQTATHASATTGLIKNKGIANALESKFSTALRAIRRGNLDAAVGSFNAGLNFLLAQSGKGIDSSFVEVLAEALLGTGLGHPMFFTQQDFEIMDDVTTTDGRRRFLQGEAPTEGQGWMHRDPETNRVTPRVFWGKYVRIDFYPACCEEVVWIQFVKRITIVNGNPNHPSSSLEDWHIDRPNDPETDPTYELQGTAPPLPEGEQGDLNDGQRLGDDTGVDYPQAAIPDVTQQFFYARTWLICLEPEFAILGYYSWGYTLSVGVNEDTGDPEGELNTTDPFADRDAGTGGPVQPPSLWDPDPQWHDSDGTGDSDADVQYGQLLENFTDYLPH